MPYVKQHVRTETAKPLGELIDYLRGLPDAEKVGAANYLITQLVGLGLWPDDGWSYHHLHRAYGVFGAAGAEFYRRLLADDEGQAINRNGDIGAYVI